MESLLLSCLFLFQNQSAHRSSIIQSASLHCFSFCFYIYHLAPAHLVELYLFCGHLKLCCLDVNKPLWSVSTWDFFLYLVIVLVSNLIEESDKNKSENSKKPNKKPHMFFLVFRFGSYQHLEKLHLFAPIKPNIHNEKHLCINLLDTVLVVSSNC